MTQLMCHDNLAFSCCLFHAAPVYITISWETSRGWWCIWKAHSASGTTIPELQQRKTCLNPRTTCIPVAILIHPNILGQIQIQMLACHTYYTKCK